ncbi:hypothetical protein OXX69_000018 [Metschnikowia pulcherrima]
MPQQHMDAGHFLDSPIYSQILSESPVDDDEYRPEITNPGRVPDLSFLSANFSSESLHNDVEAQSQKNIALQMPVCATNNPGNSSGPYVNGYGASNPNASNVGGVPAQNFPYANKRYSFNGSNTSLVNSPTAPVGQPSFSYHQRANSSSTRRPKSFFGESSNPIWEYAAGSPISENRVHQEPEKQTMMKTSASYSRRNSYTPSISLPPVDSRKPRSRSGSPSRSNSPVRQKSPHRQRPSSPSKLQPFNFKPQDLSVTASPSLVAKPAHRKGHRYKHSSVSMNLFQEPIPIADANHQPSLIPDSYPIPNFKESLGSATRAQKLKVAMSLAHAVTSVVVFVTGVHTQQQAFSTLAHLIFYDSLGSFMAALVDIMSNFEVWSKSSIAYPFGLGRLEVLASFALSTSSVMVGCDLISHFVEEVVVDLVDPSIGETTEHGAHHIHGSTQNGAAGWVLYEAILMLVIAVTWVTSTYIFAQAPLSELMAEPNTNKKENGLLGINSSMTQKSRFSQRVRSMSRVLVHNPIRLLTLVYSAFLSVVPLIPESLKDEFGFDLNESSTLVVASLLCYAGWNLVKTLGGILLISFPYSEYDFTVTKAAIYDRILGLANFKASYSIDKLHFTKASPTLYLAGVSVHMKGGSSDDESRLLFEINRIVVETVKNFEPDCLVETTISTDRV